MKTCNFCPLLCVFVTLILSSSFATASTHLGPSLCQDIARTNPKGISYDFCVSQLQSNPLALGATAPKIAEISFDLTLSKAKEMPSLANQLLHDKTVLDQTAKDVYTNCARAYKRKVVVYLEDGVSALKSGDLKRADSRVKSAMDEAATCEEGLKGFANVPVSLIKLDYEFYQLAAISLEFTNLLRIVN